MERSDTLDLCISLDQIAVVPLNPYFEFFCCRETDIYMPAQYPHNFCYFALYGFCCISLNLLLVSLHLSITNMGEIYFGAVDFAIFGGLLLVSAIIGIYSAIKGRKNETIENYYFGNRKMSPIPLGCSMAVSFISAITMMGTPVEVYLFGAVIVWVVIGNTLGTLFTCAYFVPLIYRLKISSVYEYLEMRFDRKVRLFCSSITVILMIFYMGFCIYMSALALNTVTPLDIKWTIILTSFVCTFYTALGGFKAVIWTDVVQSAIMLIGSAALCIQGTILVGGPSKVLEAANNGGRLNIFKITADPTVRSSLLAVLIGQTVLQSAASCSNQAMVQRIVSCDSVKNARRALGFYLLPASLIFCLAVANGCVLYAYFEDCDPLTSGKISKPDQYIPSMMIKSFENLPGMAGVFVAAVCSGTMSTVSTGINSMSVIILHDFVYRLKTSLTPRQKLYVGKICAVFIGCLITSIAYITGYLGTTTIQVATSTIGAFGGPVFGVFLAGMFVPRTNAKGALIGVVLASTLSIWMAIGAAIYGLSSEKKQMLQLSTMNCSISSSILNASTSISPAGTVNVTEINAESMSERPMIADTFYSISFYYFGLVGTFTSVLLTTIASELTGGNDPRRMNPILFVPLLDNEKFSPNLRKIFRFGVPEIYQEQKTRRDSNANIEKRKPPLRTRESEVALLSESKF